MTSQKRHNKQYKYTFEALQCDKRLNRLMNTLDPTMAGVGVKTIISFTTTTEPTQEYIRNMEKHIENIQDEKVYLTGVKFIGCELVF